MDRVTGIGGVFFKARDSQGLSTWYRKRLGLPADDDGTVVFTWRHHDRPDRIGSTVWAPFPRDTDYFGQGQASFMINYRVANLDRVLEELRAEGVEVDERIEDTRYGRFGWITDPEGNRVELWEPPAGR